MSKVLAYESDSSIRSDYDSVAFGLALLAASDVVLSTAMSELVGPRTDCRLFSLAARLTKGLSMGRIPDELRQIIAANIRAGRMKKFPGRGGGKKCAEAFGVSPQQWSPWERGIRTPDEYRLRELADFFGVTVEHMRRDHSSPENKLGAVSPPLTESQRPEPSLHGTTSAESEIIRQLHNFFSNLAADGIRLNVSMNIVLSSEEKQETNICPKQPA